MLKKDIIANAKRREAEQTDLIERIMEQSAKLKESLIRTNNIIDDKDAELEELRGNLQCSRMALTNKNENIATLAFRSTKYKDLYTEALNGYLYYEQRDTGEKMASREG